MDIEPDGAVLDRVLLRPHRPNARRHALASAGGLDGLVIVSEVTDVVNVRIGDRDRIARS